MRGISLLLLVLLSGPLAAAELLRRLGCHILQGYALARPMPADDVLAFATARTWLPALALIAAGLALWNAYGIPVALIGAMLLC